MGLRHAFGRWNGSCEAGRRCLDAVGGGVDEHGQEKNLGAPAVESPKGVPAAGPDRNTAVLAGGVDETVCHDCSVRDMAVCAPFDARILSQLHGLRTDKAIAANQILFQAGDEKRFVYTLREGMLRLFTVLPDGRRQISVFLMRGDFVGLIEDSHYTQTAEAVIPSRLCCFRKDALNAMMEKCPEMHRRLLRMTRKILRDEREKQFLLGRMNPLEKVARFIILCARQARIKGLSDNPVHFAMSRADMADYLGLTVESVSRSFSSLKRQDVIRFSRNRLVSIVNRNILHRIAGLGDNGS